MFFFTYALFLSIPHHNWKLLVQKQHINLSYSFCFQHEIMPNFFHRRLNSTIADNIITNFMFKYRSRTVKLLMEHLRKVNTVLWILLWKLYDIKKTMKKLVTKYKYYQDISKKVNVNWSFVDRLFLAHIWSLFYV